MTYTRDQLLSLSRTELRVICRQFNIRAARSNLQTVDRICAVRQPIQTLNVQSQVHNDPIASAPESNDRGPTDFTKCRPSTGMRIIVSVYNKHLLPYYVLLCVLLYYNCGSRTGNGRVPQDMAFESCHVLFAQCSEFVNGSWWFHEQSPSVPALLHHLRFPDRPDDTETGLNQKCQDLDSTESRDETFEITLMSAWSVILLMIGLLGLGLSIKRYR